MQPRDVVAPLAAELCFEAAQFEGDVHRLAERERLIEAGSEQNRRSKMTRFLTGTPASSRLGKTPRSRSLPSLPKPT